MDFIKTSTRLNDRKIQEPISEQSAETYRLMFGKFARWMVEHNKVLSQITHYDLLMFLESGSTLGRQRVPDLKSKITYRYLRLIERCLIHLQVYPNPAQHAIFDAVRSQKIGRDNAMVVLTTQQLHEFVSALPFSVPPGNWKLRRDRAMQLVMLFAGLRVAEAIGLTLEEVGRVPEPDGSLLISIEPANKHLTSYEHQTLLRPGAVADVLRWVIERETMVVPGRLVFPANAYGAQLDQATVYRQVAATFRRAGIVLPRTGGRTLRNTFASQELKNGMTTSDLRKLLGLALERSTDTYAAAGAKTE
jgi:site-specific recombinase XerD